MITTSIALVLTFGIVNLILIGEWKFNANIISSFSLMTIIILVFSLSVIALSVTSIFNRLRVLSNDFPLEMLQIVNVLLIIIALSYVVLVFNSPSTVINKLARELFSIIGISFTLFSVWVGLIKKVQLLNILIVGKNIQYCSNEYKLNGEKCFKVSAQCKGDNEDIIVFAGFCLKKDIDTIYQKESEYRKLIYKPFINDIDIITMPEKIEPHKLSSYIEISVKSIQDKCKEEGITLEENKVYILYKDSKENYFGAGVILN
ncbi:hypothetical protein [Lactobacillus taiwanensis]|uniref:hypothetical protein n=1 Tax=Lactobacillus taiwanensis TaxID=508451 RepID=UPI001AEC25D5|nr:hypothetical protein [Lactobacillus taiwanensis]QTQ39311.1 hypothetical protein H1A07_05460 [Lactobacillus taiwanensis]